MTVRPHSNDIGANALGLLHVSLKVVKGHKEIMCVLQGPVPNSVSLLWKPKTLLLPFKCSYGGSVPQTCCIRVTLSARSGRSKGKEIRA